MIFAWPTQRQLGSVIVGLLLYFSICELTFLVRSNTVRNNIMMNKAFCKSTDGHFDRSIARRKVKFITRICIYSIKDKALSVPWIQCSNEVSLPPDCWLVTLGNGDQFGSLLLNQSVGQHH